MFRRNKRGMGVHVVTGSHYLVCFVVDAVLEKAWIDEKVKGWIDSVEVLSGVAPRHPYKAYVRMQKSLQQACAFVQRITPGVREDFCPVEEALQKSFLPALFQGCKDEVLI